MRLVSDSRSTRKGLQPQIKHLPICPWHCCVQLRRDTVTQLICRPATLWQHIWGVHQAGMVLAELLSKRMKISFHPVHCCVAIIGSCWTVVLRDPVTPGEEWSGWRWVDFCTMAVYVQKDQQCDPSRALGAFLRCPEKLLSPCVGGKKSLIGLQSSSCSQVPAAAAAAASDLVSTSV